MLPGVEASELAVWLETGDAGCEELVRARLAGLDKLSKLGAVAWRDDEQVLAEARRADARRVAGESLGPLHGLPVTVKDWIDVTGFPCAGGDASHLGRRPTVDAALAPARRRPRGFEVWFPWRYTTLETS